MADRFTYRANSVAQTLQQSFPQGAATNTVVYSIYDVDDAAFDVLNTAMDSVTGNTFKASWTPTESHNYMIDFWNQTLDVHFYEYCQVTGTVIGVSGGSGLGSTFSTLKTNLLKLIDQFNGTGSTTGDTGNNSADDIAGICINQGLQKCYSVTKDSKYLQAYPSSLLVSTIGQSYIDLSGISDIDEVAGMQDTVNNRTLTCIPYWRYKLEVPDPSKVTGIPYRYARWFNRIYLDPQPTTAITYQTDYIKNFADLSTGTDRSLLPSKYDYWIISEAKVIWLLMEDPGNNATLLAFKSDRDDARAIAVNDIMSNFDMVPEPLSHWDGRGLLRPGLYDTPFG